MKLALYPSQLQLFLWAWLCILLCFISFTHGLGPPSTLHDRAPRVAIVAIAQEDDLSDIVVTIRQLEESFNSRFQYQWVFFNTVPLSEIFRQVTSNATKAVCLYEVLAEEDDVAINHPASHGSLVAPSTENPHPNVYSRPQSRRNLSLFAKQSRMRDYEWFWRVEPGARFAYSIQFDVFRFMRDHGIFYGFTGLARRILDDASDLPQVRSFIDKHPGLLHAEANISWRIRDLGYSTDSGESALSSGRQGSEVRFSLPQTDEFGDDGHQKPSGWQKWLAHVGKNRIQEDTTTSHADAFASWLLAISEGENSPAFELGSLAFFRSPSHQALIDHIDVASDRLGYSPVEIMPVHSLSASMFLPKQSVWNFRKPITVAKKHLPKPMPTPSPEEPPCKSKVSSPMEKQYALWDEMAEDLTRQSEFPGLRSGNTVIDERNFVQYYPHSGEKKERTKVDDEI